MGRPSNYSAELATTICERIADGESLRSICSEVAMPGKSTVMHWLEQHHEFASLMARARDLQADALFDEMINIADDGRNDWMERQASDGQAAGWRENGEAIRRSQIRISTRQWMAARLQPKKYGDKLDLNHSGQIAAAPMDWSALSHEKKIQLLALLEEASGANNPNG